MWKFLSFSQLLRRVPGAGHVSTGSTSLGHWSSQVVLGTPGPTVVCLENFLQSTSIHRPPCRKGGLTHDDLVYCGQICLIHQVLRAVVVSSRNAEQNPSKIIGKNLGRALVRAMFTRFAQSDLGNPGK